MNSSSCRAVVTSPKYWSETGCYIIGDYTLSSDDADGWATAERRCFETSKTKLFSKTKFYFIPTINTY